ncbi:putative F-box/LRR-repeat protein 23 [Acorus gramineus]|uniref:F-box/LRR-repeat protein 23 n=1 Tax=Acorus gramineus TaxID=55184 RepID=A0AAV9BSJ7_ACOGR|nr:putative F-box/LRR-repeat protein 23 [Acorus gramineus]
MAEAAAAVDQDPAPEAVEEETRDWAEMSPDLLSVVFEKVGALGVLCAAQAVCPAWRRVSLQPHLWRSVDMRNPWQPWDLMDSDEFDLERMARNAIDRADGNLVEISFEYFATDDLIKYVSERTNILKCLRLVSCYQVMDEALIEAAQKFPLLEELEISHCSFSTEVLEAIGRSCPQLKCLRLNCRGYLCAPKCDETAIIIAKHMPGLRRLQLFGNLLSNDGLHAILDGCPQLESLDIRQCFNVCLEGSLRKTCLDRIKNLKLPSDPTDDYEFCTELCSYGLDLSDGSDAYDYESDFSEMYDSYFDDSFEYYDFEDPYLLL